MSGANLTEDTLLGFPPLIKSQQEEILTALDEVEKKNVEVKEIVASFNSQINANPALKNAEQRTVELKAKMAASAEYTVNNDLLIGLRLDAETKKIHLEYLQNMFRAHLAIVSGGNR